MGRDSTQRARQEILVLLGDPSLSDPSKREGRYHEEDLEAVARMKVALEGLGRYRPVYRDRHQGLLEFLHETRPAFVVNFCDTGYRNQPNREWHVAALLELLEIPYSGATPAAMALCYDKGAVRGIAQSLGIPVPDERYCETADEARRALGGLPVIIKPNQGDGSVGITQHAVVRERTQAEDYLAYCERELPGRALLLQEYLPGPEYSLGVLGDAAQGLSLLPLLTVDFSGLPAGLEPILSFESKAVPDSPYWNDIRYVPAQVPPDVHESLGDTARRLFPRLGLRDYARFDFRTDAQGRIKLLEVNPNPAWGYDGKMALMAGFAGWSYGELLGRLIDNALVREGLATGSRIRR